ncbi:putative Uncharacterized ATP-dependent helicase C23E6.02 [Glarea lozoyensis 74030]|nr:putative Uncharacterized ATP-dependent helicase C23E6.02 [Glarea lozoyensis 74030]
MEDLFNRQERKDLEKLGNIAISYLKARPWANRPEDKDTASWVYHVMQPRHGSKSHGNLDCLRATLESMIIRHRPEDVQKDVALPPLYQKVVYLDGSMQDIMSLNTFAMMIVGNAVTSERKDVDYLFHASQVKALQSLVSNLRQASFFWSGYTHSDITSSLNTFKGFLEKGEVAVSDSDRKLLETSITVGKIILRNRISEAKSVFHEMPMYMENNLSTEAKEIWALDNGHASPTLIGASSILALRKVASTYVSKTATESFTKRVLEEGRNNRRRMYRDATPSMPNRNKDSATHSLAGSVTAGNDSNKRLRTSRRTPNVAAAIRSPSTATLRESHTNSPTPKKSSSSKPGPSGAGHLSDAEKLNILNNAIECSDFKTSAKLVSTGSAKLSYLMDRILAHSQTTEKVLIFYESNNVAYYIGEALELLGIKHLFFAKTLKIKQRADHIVEFNADPECKVLIMDVSQAAFGLDLSSASRVYFINPILNPQIEAQAVKRAHRIGQSKPVYVETLVLKGSIEELILTRRKDMSPEEHKKCKSILDDDIIFDWIRNGRFLELPSSDIPGSDQMARLDSPQPLFRANLFASPPAVVLVD